MCTEWTFNEGDARVNPENNILQTHKAHQAIYGNVCAMSLVHASPYFCCNSLWIFNAPVLLVPGHLHYKRTSSFSEGRHPHKHTNEDKISKVPLSTYQTYPGKYSKEPLSVMLSYEHFCCSLTHPTLIIYSECL